MRPDDDGARLDAAVGRAFVGMSRKLARQAILSGTIKLNGKVVKIFARNVKAGDTLVWLDDVRQPVQEKKRADIEILYEDDALFVIDKPARLLSERVPGEGGAAIGDVLAQQGKGKTWLVHRLDAGTSGVMMLARSEKAAEKLSDQFRAGQVDKSYLLLCAGNPGEGTFREPLGRDSEHPRRFAVRKDGKSAITHYKTLVEKAGFAIVNVGLETGRTHQIRVHFTHAGFPLLGDKMYGGRTRVDTLLVDRTMLHAWALRFRHPLTNKALEFRIPPKEDMRRVFEGLGLVMDFDRLTPLW